MGGSPDVLLRGSSVKAAEVLKVVVNKQQQLHSTHTFTQRGKNSNCSTAEVKKGKHA